MKSSRPWRRHPAPSHKLDDSLATLRVDAGIDEVEVEVEVEAACEVDRDGHRDQAGAGRIAPPSDRIVHGLAPMGEVWLGDPNALVRTLMVGVFAYLGLIAILRASGTRTLAKLNAFDLVVTVALGSTLATILLSREVALAQGLLALALLVALQFAITWTSVRWPWVRRLVTGDPRLLWYRGERLPDALRQARIADEELRSAARSAGCPELERVAAIVLETDGSLSVIADLGPAGLTGLAAPESLPQRRCSSPT